MAIFGQFRRFVDAIEGLTSVLTALAEQQRELGPALDRVTELEVQRHQFEAKIDGVLLKAEGKLSAANNSEARERQMKRSYERNADLFPEAGDDETPIERDAILSHDATPGEAAGVPALRLDVAHNNKALAQRVKWGVA